MNNSKLLVLPLFVFLGACGQKHITQQIDASVEANQQSVTLADWEMSALHPGALARQWKQDKVKSEDVCEALMDRTDEELTMFEETMEDGELNEALAACSDKIHDRLTSYWDQQAQIVQVQASSGRRMESKTIYRDLTNGYYIVNADLAPKQIMLTFDDGPHAAFTDSILKSLASYNAKATFLALGNSVKANPSVLKRVAAAGHSIGSHSISHPCMGSSRECGGKNIGIDSAMKQIRGGHQAVFNVLGWVDPIFRFPYGAATAEAKSYLRRNQIAEAFWSIDSNDWRNKSPEKLISDVMSQLNKQGRGVILFHDIQKKTMIAMPRLLSIMADAGYQPVIMKPSNPTPPGTKLLQ